MMRTIVDIPKEQLKVIAAICNQRRISRAELIRNSIDLYIQANASSTGEAFGLLKNRPLNSLQYQQDLRSEWG